MTSFHLSHSALKKCFKNCPFPLSKPSKSLGIERHTRRQDEIQKDSLYGSGAAGAARQVSKRIGQISLALGSETREPWGFC